MLLAVLTSKRLPRITTHEDLKTALPWGSPGKPPLHLLPAKSRSSLPGQGLSEIPPPGDPLNLCARDRRKRWLKTQVLLKG